MIPAKQFKKEMRQATLHYLFPDDRRHDRRSCVVCCEDRQKAKKRRKS